MHDLKMIAISKKNCQIKFLRVYYFTTFFLCVFEAVTKGRMMKWISVTKLIFLTGALELCFLNS